MFIRLEHFSCFFRRRSFQFRWTCFRVLCGENRFHSIRTLSMFFSEETVFIWLEILTCSFRSIDSMFGKGKKISSNNSRSLILTFHFSCIKGPSLPGPLKKSKKKRRKKNRRVKGKPMKPHYQGSGKEQIQRGFEIPPEVNSDKQSCLT